jgi:hypothetical protein
MAMVFSANRSKVQLDGEAVEGLQSLVYRVVTARQDIPGIGSGERVDVIFGLRTVQGELVVRSVSTRLDDNLKNQSKFQIVAELKKDEAQDAPRRKLSFDECYVEGKSFSLDASGTAITTYNFTATRVREE